MNLNEESRQPIHPSKMKVPDHLATGEYATGMITSHTKEEFVLDFISSFAQPPRVVARVILSPPHVKRLASAIRSNLDMYEKHFGLLPEPPAKSDPVKSAPAQDFYSQLTVPDLIVMGNYSNSALINHSREEFVLSFVANFPPTPVLTARILVSPSHLRRIARVLETRVRMYEKSFGALPGRPPTTEDDDLPPESGSRFSLS